MKIVSPETLMERVTKARSGCWIWEGARSKEGYGVLRLDDGQRQAPRLFWETFVGPVPAGYAVTSHSSQGLTAERVLINADTNVHPDLLNSRFGYVSISRASHDATLFTNDMAKLNPQLSAEVSKSAALDIGQMHSVGQVIGF